MTSNPVSAVLIAELERLAANTWPAAEVQPYGRWLHRASKGVTKRANSVLTAGLPPESKDWYAEACRFYNERSLPVRFHISPATPPYVDRFLESRGFLREAETVVMTGDPRQALDRLPEDPGGWEALIHTEPTPAWMESFLAFGHPYEHRDVYEVIFGAIGPAKCFLELKRDGVPVGVGTAVVENGWAGFVNIAADESVRRQGVGSRIVSELIRWSLGQGAERLYLQVVADNEPAVRLYSKAGYRELYRYHYRSLP
ncbi:putative N-acetyltransferase YobR [Paenibacillus sp. J31TS4]|uniref:GNAT family N-acetyltransferase n=1 Tax=Paenibacillus sp. J31TS4 TaxID=2807195 RepID=UPI001B29D011|nr:GNAT family N-acetyltransferase [Paenibacillus sp. J31TS4]GIP37329.1 putative N-acetyltransferase YobR [Paenibacillus sp. J31TS4]